MTLTVVKKALREYLAPLHFVHHKPHTENMKPISFLRSEKLAIKHLSSGFHFIGVAILSVQVLKFLLILCNVIYHNSLNLIHP
jgi:hypothetical protein